MRHPRRVGARTSYEEGGHQAALNTQRRHRGAGLGPSRRQVSRACAPSGVGVTDT
jgi:hypothetical protein